MREGHIVANGIEFAFLEEGSGRCYFCYMAIPTMLGPGNVRWPPSLVPAIG